MSKSLGNGIDPLEVIDSHGADAMRFTLVSMTTQTQDVRMPVKKIDAARRAGGQQLREVRPRPELLQQAVERLAVRDDEPRRRAAVADGSTRRPTSPTRGSSAG